MSICSQSILLSISDFGNLTPATYVGAVQGSPSSGSVSIPGSYQVGDLAILAINYPDSDPTGWTKFGDTWTMGYYQSRLYSRIIQSGETSYSVNAGSYGYLLVVLRGHTKIDSVQTFGSLENGSSATRSTSKNGSIICFGADRGATVGTNPTWSISSGEFNYTFGPLNTAAFQEYHRIQLDYNAGTEVTLTDYSDNFSSGGMMILTV